MGAGPRSSLSTSRPLDDDPAEQRCFIEGVRVPGAARADLARIVRFGRP
jgi:hypothetical protein